LLRSPLIWNDVLAIEAIVEKMVAFC